MYYNSLYLQLEQQSNLLLFEDLLMVPATNIQVGSLF